MNEKNELNDIILNKNSSSIGNKKVVLSIATLGIILIVVIMLMNSISSRGTDNLPQAVLPPEPAKQAPVVAEEPLFEEVPVIEENSQQKDSLDAIAQKLKNESTKEQEHSKSTPSTKQPVSQPQESSKEQPKQAQKQPVAQKQETQKEAKKSTVVPAGLYYVQVGSFQKNQPNQKLLDGISSLGYNYKFHEVVINSKTLSKVLVGPFKDESEARKALLSIKNSVEKNAFLTKI